MKKLKRATLFSLSAMLIMSCSTGVHLNSTGAGTTTTPVVLSSLDINNAKDRISVSNNQTDMAKYVTHEKQVISVDKTGFKTKDILPNRFNPALQTFQFTSVASVRDPNPANLAQAAHTVPVINYTSKQQQQTREIQTMIDRDNADLSKLTAQQKKISDQIAGISGVDLTQAQTDLDALNSTITNLQNDMDNLQNDMNTFQNDLGTLNSDMVAIQASGDQNAIDAQQALIDAKTSQISQQQGLIDTKQSQIDDTQSQISNNLAYLTNGLKNINSKISQVTEDKNNLMKKISGISTQVAPGNSYFASNYNVALNNITGSQDGNGNNIIKATDQTENGGTNSYTLIIDSSDPNNIFVASRIMNAGMEIHKIYSEVYNGKSLLFEVGTDHRNAKAPGQNNLSFVKVSDISNPTRPVLLQFKYLAGFAATSVGSAGDDNIFVTTGQDGETYVLDKTTLKTIQEIKAGNGDFRDAVYNPDKDTLTVLDGGFKDGVSGSAAAIYIYDADKNFSAIANYPVDTSTTGSAGLNAVSSNEAKATIGLIFTGDVNTPAIYDIAASEGGLDIMDDSGMAVASDVVAGQTLNAATAIPVDQLNLNSEGRKQGYLGEQPIKIGEPGLFGGDGSSVIFGAVGYYGVSMWYFDNSQQPATLNGIGSAEFWQRDPNLDTSKNQDGGGSTNNVLYSQDDNGVNWVVAANGVNGTRFTVISELGSGTLAERAGGYGAVTSPSTSASMAQ